MISEKQAPIQSGFNSKSESSDILKGINLEGKLAIVTGGYSGIGLETTKGLIIAGADVIIPAKRPDVAFKNLKGIVPNKNIIQMDLANLNSVRKFTESINENFNKLDILINNAGIMACPETRIGDNWECQFAVNHIGHFLLTKNLMPIMKDIDGARFISLSSSAHALTSILWDDIHFHRQPYDKWMAYGQSKTASSLIAIEFNEKMKNYGVKGFAVHPGGIITPLQRHLPKEEMVALGWMQEDGSPTELVKNFFKSPNQGSSTSLWCATNKRLDGIGGVFCEDCDVARRKCEVEESMQRYFGVADWAIDTNDSSKLWEITEKMISAV